MGILSGYGRADIFIMIIAAVRMRAEIKVGLAEGSFFERYIKARLAVISVGQGREASLPDWGTRATRIVTTQ